MKYAKNWKISTAVLVSLLCGSASALDLGELKVKSSPGEPFKAIVALKDVPKKIKIIDVGLASEEEFSKALIGYSEDLKDLDFDAYRKNEEVYIQISTESELEEEVIHFILAVKVANARLMREYVVIAENDVYDTHAQPTIIQISPIKPQKLKQERVVFEPEFEKDEMTEMAEHENEEVLINEQEYRVKAGDTLWVIAKTQVKGANKANFYKVMAALKEMNPEAFIDNNINQLRAGAELSLPSIAQISQMDLDEEIEIVLAQLREYSQPTAQSAKAENAATSTATKTSAANKNQEQLRILTPKVIGGATEEASTQEQVADLREELAYSNETLISVQRNNEELQERITSLEAQIATLKELIAAREQQIAEKEMQTGMKAGNAEQTIPGVALGMNNSDLWQKLTTSEWGKYLGYSLAGLIVLLILLKVMRRRSHNQHDEQPEQRPSESKSEEFSAETSEGDEMAVKLELAQAYYDIGDTPGARVLLQEIIRNGNLNQRHTAEALMAKIEMESRQK